MVLWIFAFLIKPSFGQYFTGPIASGLGGASLGAVENTEAHLFNPASVVHGSAVEFAGLYRNGGLADGENHRTWGLTLSDNTREAYFPGALTVLLNKRAVPGLPLVDEQYAQLSLAEFVVPHLSIGIGGIYLRQRIADLGQNYEQWNGVLGVLYNPTAALGVGANLAYFVHPSSTVPQALRLPQTFGLGMHYLFVDFLRFRADVVKAYDNGAGQKWVWKAGFETMTAPFLILRFGGRRDENLRQTVATAGFSFNGPRLKFDYSFEKDVAGNNGALHSVDLRVAF